MRKYTDQELIDAIKSSSTWRVVMTKLDLCVGGWNLKTLKRRVEKLNVCIKHFQKKRDNSGAFIKIPIEEYLNGNRNISSRSLKKRLLKENLLKERCSKCDLGPEWQNEKLVLQLDHIDGDRNNNGLENLRILCPNCHTQTPTYSGKSSKNKRCKCRNVINPWTNYCRDCRPPHPSHKPKIDWPDLPALVKLVEENGYSKTGRILGVSDNAIRKHIARKNPHQTKV